MATGKINRTYPIPPLSDAQVRRFHATVGRAGPDDCWIWQGTRIAKDYGYFKACGKMLKASRVAYLLHYGHDPVGLYVLHRCDNPPCVNPAHLFLGTPHDNNQDCLAKGRLRLADPSRTTQRGVDNGMSKMTEEKVRQLRSEAASHSCSQFVLADKYGIQQTTVSRILLRQTWRHVT